MSQPDDALIEAIAKVLNRFHHGPGFPWDEASEAMRELFRHEARAAYAAMVDHLGLTEERERGKCEIDLRDHNDKDCEPGPGHRRLVSKWQEVQHARCGAEQNTANLPANNPPHVCVDEDPDHWPRTKHHDYSGFEWDQPEPRHTWGPP